MERTLRFTAESEREPWSRRWTLSLYPPPKVVRRKKYRNYNSEAS